MLLQDYQPGQGGNQYCLVQGTVSINNSVGSLYTAGPDTAGGTAGLDTLLLPGSFWWSGADLHTSLDFFYNFILLFVIIQTRTCNCTAVLNIHVS